MEKPDCQTSSSETVSKFRNNYIEVWNHKRSKFRRTNVTNLKTALSPFACYSMINLHFAVRSTYQSYKWLHGKIVEFYVKVRTKLWAPTLLVHGDLRKLWTLAFGTVTVHAEYTKRSCGCSMSDDLPVLCDVRLRPSYHRARCYFQ